MIYVYVRNPRRCIRCMWCDASQLSCQYTPLHPAFKVVSQRWAAESVMGQWLRRQGKWGVPSSVEVTFGEGLGKQHSCALFTVKWLWSGGAKLWGGVAKNRNRYGGSAPLRALTLTTACVYWEDYSSESSSPATTESFSAECRRSSSPLRWRMHCPPVVGSSASSSCAHSPVTHAVIGQRYAIITGVFI